MKTTKSKDKRKILRGRPYSEDDSKEDTPTKPPLALRQVPFAVTSVKTRKELRKEQRKAKKAMKHQYLLAKVGRDDLVTKAAEAIFGKGKKKKKKKRKNKNKKKGSGGGDGEGKTVESAGDGKRNEEKSDGGESEESEEEEDEDEKFVREAVQNKLEGKETIDLAEELKYDKVKMRKEMDEVRRKRLIEENEEEERTINQLSKKLKLNKKAAIPASFRTDGLDFLLELCERGSKKKKNEDDSSDDEKDKDSDYDDDEMGDINEEGSDLGSELDDDLGDEDGTDEQEEISEDEDEGLENDRLIESEEEDQIASGGVDGEPQTEMMGSDDDENEDGEHFDHATDSDQDDNEESENHTKSKKGVKSKKKAKTDEEKEEDDGIWEDIYGRLRAKDGSVLSNSNTTTVSEKTSNGTSGSGSGKYIPPALRGNQSKREKIVKQLKGLLNRLSESNMHNIATQIEEMYMTNSRNEMNQTLLELLTAVLVRHSVTPERVVLEHVMLIAVLHANVGTEVGAFFTQSFTQEFKTKYDEWDDSQDQENKHLENLVLIIAFIFHFKIIDSCLIFDILKFLSDSFKSKDVELVLTVLRSVGFRLRKDDPSALKELILTLQQKASKLQSGATGSAKVKFMLEILMAIRNNNMNKIPNYDPSFGEHLLKILKSHLHPGNYVSELKIGLQDLLNADKAGRWWIVGSAWAGKQTDQSTNGGESSDKVPMTSEDALKHAKLMKRARKQGMNTDTRRNIFCILMTAEDYMDAFEKLNHLGLRNNQDREIMHVTVHCCLQEKQFNPYYALIASKFCTMDRKLMYPPSFKEEIRQYAQVLGQRAASRLFAISQKRIFEWVTEAKSLPNSNSRTRAAVLQSRRKNLTKLRKSLPLLTASLEMKNFQSHECKPTSKEVDAKVEEEVQQWMESQAPRKVPSSEIRQKAREVYRDHGRSKIECSYGWYRRFMQRMTRKEGGNARVMKMHDDEDALVLTWLLQVHDNNQLVSYRELQEYAQNSLKEIRPNFKASAGWALRFLKRNHILVNWNEGLYIDKFPSALESQVMEFREALKNLLNKYSLDSVGCMDEVPLSFSSPTTSKLKIENEEDEFEDCKVSRLRKLSVKNCDATVVLGMLADGTFMPPMVIVKGQLSSSMNQVYNAPQSSIVVYYSTTTEPSVICFEKWIDLIWTKAVSDESLIILDSYENHAPLQRKFDACNTKYMEIPAGCSLKLQPLNVLAKDIFVKNMEKLWLEYLQPDVDSMEDSVEKMKLLTTRALPSTNEVVEWVQKSYEATLAQKAELLKSFSLILS